MIETAIRYFSVVVVLGLFVVLVNDAIKYQSLAVWVVNVIIAICFGAIVFASFLQVPR